MNNLPTKCTKKELIDQLSNEDTNIDTIQRIKDLPEKFEDYDLNIIFDRNNAKYEINYFSYEKMEFLFSYKVYDSIEDNIDNIEKSLQRLN